MSNIPRHAPCGHRRSDPAARTRLPAEAGWSLAALVLSLGCAGPVLAQFSPREGLTTSGAPEWRAELEPYIWLPATRAEVGLGRAPGIDPTFNVPAPTLANVVSNLDGAFSCSCLVRYGNWSAEVNINYVALSDTKTIPPILPGGPGQQLNAKASLFYIAPGIGYRILPKDDMSKVSLDLRAGFSYASVNANADFEGTRLPEGSFKRNFTQPWIGERLAYYPSPKWRLESTLALTGLGVQGGAIGWNGRVGVSYLAAKWLDVSAGYAGSQTFRNKGPGPNGENNTLDVLEYGPYIGAGFRF